MNFNSFLEDINNAVWGNGLIFLLLSAGILYTIKLRFIQLRFIPSLLKNPNNKTACGKGISQAKTVCMSLGTAMGTGNITGVASAVSIGGAGAVFWMWVSAFLGMALVYAENYLAAFFGHSCSYKGPMAYLKNGLGCKILPVIFAIFCVGASLGMGGMVQVSSFSDCLSDCVKINPAVTALLIFIFIFTVISGGAERIGLASQFLLPAAAIGYTAVSAAVIIKFHENILPAFRCIFSEAFSFDSAAGGLTGFAVSKAVSTGIRRGIFSNEAGLGSSPILHSASENSSPQLQGMWSMFEVFFDTFICCTITALVLLSAYDGREISVMRSFSCILGNGTEIFLTAIMAVFAFCTVIGWYFCGETAFTFIFGLKCKRIFSIAFPLISSLGAVLTVSAVWTISDIFNGLMAFPNLLALILLMKYVKKE